MLLKNNKKQDLRRTNLSPPGFISRYGWIIAVMLILPLVGFLIWYWRAPQNLISTIGPFLSSSELKIEGLEIVVHNQSRFLKPGDSNRVNPQAKLFIKQLKSNHWQNYDLNLESPNLNLKLLQDPQNKTSLVEILGEDNFITEQEIIIEVKNKKEVKGTFTIISSFSALDWVSKAEAAKKTEDKIYYYQNALNLDPKTTVIREKLALLFLNNQQYAQASLLWEEIYEIKPHKDTLEELLKIYTLADDFSGQEKTFKRLINIDKKNNLSHRKNLALLFNKQKKYDEAINIYQELIKTNPFEEQIFLTDMANIYRQSDQAEKELDIWQKLLNLTTDPAQKRALISETIRLAEKTNNKTLLLKSWEDLASVLPIGKQKAAAYKKIGFIYAQNGNYEKAKYAYQESLKLDPNDQNVYLNLSRLALANKNQADYIETLEKMISLWPDNLDYLIELTEVYRSLNINDKAINGLKKILEKKPEDQKTRKQLLALLELKEDKSELISEYKIFSQQNSSDKVALYNLAILYHKNKQDNKAVETFLKVIELDPKDLKAREYLLSILQEQKQDDLAMEQAQELYKLNPENKKIRDIALIHYKNKENWDKLITLTDFWLKNDLGDALIWESQALAYQKLNNFEKAFESYSKAASLEANQISLWLKAGQTALKANLTAEAKKSYQKVLELSQGNVEAEKALLEINLKELQGNSNPKK